MAPLTAEEYARLRATADRMNAWADTKRGKDGWASYRAEEVPMDCRITNDELSAIEVYEWLHHAPERYFAYVKGYERGRLYLPSGELTTWTGDKLGEVTFGTPWIDSFGGRRVPIKAVGTNGRRYHGTYFESSGDYARIRAYKG